MSLIPYPHLPFSTSIYASFETPPLSTSCRIPPFLNRPRRQVPSSQWPPVDGLPDYSNLLPKRSDDSTLSSIDTPAHVVFTHEINPFLVALSRVELLLAEQVS